jgi:general L-amino acid transport system permease protein
MTQADAAQAHAPLEPPRVPFWRAGWTKGALWQGALLAAFVWLAWSAVENTAENMRLRGVPTDFSFWWRPAGFDVNQTLIPFSSSSSTYGEAFLVGLLNTLLVAALGVVLATVLGFLIGVARLSTNWIVAKLAAVYVEVIRNTPLLLQLLFWYNAALKPLPNPRQSVALPGGIYLNNRGLFAPEPIFGPHFDWTLWALGAAVVVSLGLRAYGKRLRATTSRRPPMGRIALALMIGLPLLAFLAAGAPLAWSVPELRGFNFQGGVRIYPEFVALLLGLSLYTAAFIAEIVRAGVLSVSHGQSEAAAALGLPRVRALRLVVIPQAMRVVVPPLTNQYLNLTKNSSLAVFVGYPDLVQVFAGTVLNQTGAAVQVISITMAVYLVISLATSAAMNLYNRRMALAER